MLSPGLDLMEEEVLDLTDGDADVLLLQLPDNAPETDAAERKRHCCM